MDDGSARVAGFRLHDHGHAVDVLMSRTFRPFAGRFVRIVRHFTVVQEYGADEISVHDPLLGVDEVSFVGVDETLRPRRRHEPGYSERNEQRSVSAHSDTSNPMITCLGAE